MFDRNSLNAKNVVLIALGVVVASFGIWTLMQPGTTPSAGEGQKIADAFLAAMQAGSADKAWESTTLPTYAAITSRSHHVGSVTVLMMDGAVRGVGNSIDLNIWRGVGTRNGKEVGALD